MLKDFSFSEFAKKWLVPIILLLVITYAYFAPVLGGKVIVQDDIMMGRAKIHQIDEYRQKTGEEPFWTNSMFSGMPTFQLSTSYPNNWLGAVQTFIANIFGKSSWLYIFPLMIIGFFLLARSYEVDPWISVMGAIAFTFSAFFVISFAAGHISKVRTAAYMAPIIMGVILTYKGKLKTGFCVTALSIGLSVLSNHVQITYYTLIIILCLGIVYLIDFLKQKEIGIFIKRSLIVVIAALIGVAPNIGNLWSTLSYTKETIRGGSTKLEQAKGSDVSSSSGLSYDYAMMWSYGKLETLNLFVPFLSGGGAKESYENTDTYNKLHSIFQQQGMGREKAEQAANQYTGSILYWGDQSLVNGAYYVGAGMVFLFLLGLFIVPKKTRNWIIAATIISILMAWGQNLEFFNKFLFNHLPLYNKFRVPSMSLVMVFFMVPLSAVLGLREIMQGNLPKETLKKKALLTFYIIGGLAAFIALLGPTFFDLAGPRDQQFVKQGLDINMILDDRSALLRSSAFKSLLFVALTFGAVWLYIIEKLKKPLFSFILIALICIDLIPYDRDQLGKDEFITPKNAEANFIPSQADKTILQDNDPYYRVWNTTAGLTSDSYTSYYHHSIGGYHGAKLARYQDLIENQLSKQNMACFDMLNTKWIIINQKGQKVARLNPNACGNAWFVNTIQLEDGPVEVMNAMDNFDPHHKAIVDKEFKDYVKDISPIDSAANNHISLTSYDPKDLKYQTSVSSPKALAVFSEIYYNAPGQKWHAYIDGKEVDYIRVNYLLRALKIPQGKHDIEFKFIPKTYIMGEKIDLISSIVLFGTIAVFIIIGIKNSAQSKPE